MNLSAFVLAAGLGERLLPITQYIPKPLLPILGKPVLESFLEKVSALPINNIGINLHHKRTIIEDWIKQSVYTMSIFPEDPILGTGGALKNAESFLKKGPFLVHNADILSDIDLRRLIEAHVSSGNIATLAVHNYPEFNSLIIDKKGFLKDFIKHPHTYHPPSAGGGKEKTPPRRNIEYLDSTLPTAKSSNMNGSSFSSGRGSWGGGTGLIQSLAFTGVAIYQPDFLQFLPQGNSSVVDAWFNALSAGYKIGTYDVTGCYWTDIGTTPSSYARAVMHEMRKQGENIYIHQSVRGCTGAALDGYVVIESKTSILKGSVLRNCISLPGATIGKTLTGKEYENCIVGPDFIVNLRESDFYDTDNNDNFLIGTGGSDRKYYRIKKNGPTEVIVQCRENDPDLQRHIAYTVFFKRYGVAVPDLKDESIRNGTVTFEDLGDLTLYSWLKCPRLEDQVEHMYRLVLDILLAIHTTASKNVHECPLLRGRMFDYKYLRWETHYFLEQFVKRYQGIHINNSEALQREFHELAATVNDFSKTIVHRDFQSQNIMVTKGGTPKLLDYQGARIGPPAYDVVSLLWDPYYRLQDRVREKLLEYYIDKVISLPLPLKKERDVTPFARNDSTQEKISPFTKGGLRGLTEKEFRETLLPCRLQRHMQALGAYGFLSAIKGKNYFLKYVPEGIRLLKEDISIAHNQYPALDALITQL